LADLFFIYFPLGLLQVLRLAANSKIKITDNKKVVTILLKRVPQHDITVSYDSGVLKASIMPKHKKSDYVGV